MRMSEGVFFGRIAKLYNPEKFQDREEVIGFPREDFNRTYTSIAQQIDYINKIGLHLDRSEEWKLIGYWPKIMQRVHRIDMHMALILKKEPLQSYLDAYLYDNIQNPQKNIVISESEAITKIKVPNLDLFY